MELWEAIQCRHSVREYTDRRIEGETLAALVAEIDAVNAESGLHIQLALDEPEAFKGLLAHYGKLINVRNYIVLIGKADASLAERAGYYGERIVLRAQQLGLNTCWVALTYRKGKARCRIAEGEKRVCVISLGYGKTQGVPHKSKPLEALCKVEGDMPAWFRRGMEAALLAPTATNQQRFLITLENGRVRARSLGGPCDKIDLGIVRYHFEVGAGKENFEWA